VLVPSEVASGVPREAEPQAVAGINLPESEPYPMALFYSLGGQSPARARATRALLEAGCGGDATLFPHSLEHVTGHSNASLPLLL
jgi:hypothetical protein